MDVSPVYTCLGLLNPARNGCGRIIDDLILTDGSGIHKEFHESFSLQIPKAARLESDADLLPIHCYT